MPKIMSCDLASKFDQQLWLYSTLEAQLGEVVSQYRIQQR